MSESMFWMTVWVFRMSATCASRLRIRLRECQRGGRIAQMEVLTPSLLHLLGLLPASVSRTRTPTRRADIACKGGSLRPRSASSACDRHSVMDESE